jgi:hypothetical protein
VPDVCAALQQKPAGHGICVLSSRFAVGQKKPARHGAWPDAAVAFVAKQKPGAHARHDASEVPPVVARNVPAGHGVGAAEPAGQ